MKLVVFILIELLLYPFSMIGVILFMTVIVIFNRPRGISGTAYEPLMNRVIYHELGSRSDPAAVQLGAALPATHPLIWLLMMGPTRLAIRLSGYCPQVFSFPPESPPKLTAMMTVRTAFMDTTLEEALDDVGQLVILGAGWDTRAYGLPAGWSGRVFEVDAPATQEAKRTALARAGIDASHVTFVAVDFNRTTWLEALSARGFDPAVPTYLLWEGVTMYLDESALVDTLKTAATLAPGSRIAFDYFPAEMIRGEKPHRLVGKVLPFAMWLTYGERLVSGIPMQPEPRQAVADYVAASGLALNRFEVIAPWYGFALAGPAV